MLADTTTPAPDVVRRAYDLEALITELRRDFHKHPELGFQEHRTARRVADELRTLGLEVMTGVGKTGVVGILGEGKPTVAIRADMDALPIHEANQVDYASQHPGVMHACGHDAHTAILLGVARILKDLPDRPAGEIRFLFQPCEETEDEEGKSGGERMVEEGALNGVDRVIALHVDSDLPAGEIVIQDGYISAACDTFRARIIGKGCHAAHPDQGIDPIYLASHIIQAIHGIRARRTNPIRPALISIGGIHGGQGDNVIPDEVAINGTMRSYDEETRQTLRTELERALSIARLYEGDYALQIISGCPSTYNDPQVAEVIRATARELFGENAVVHREGSLGAEDFSYMTKAAPGAMFMLGAKKDERHRPHHNPHFDLDEHSFPRGAALLAATTVRLLRSLAE